MSEPTLAEFEGRVLRAVRLASEKLPAPGPTSAAQLAIRGAVIEELRPELELVIKAWHGLPDGLQVPPGPALLYVFSDGTGRIATLDRLDWSGQGLPYREEALMEALMRYVDKQREGAS